MRLSSQPVGCSREHSARALALLEQHREELRRQAKLAFQAWLDASNSWLAVSRALHEDADMADPVQLRRARDLERRIEQAADLLQQLQRELTEAGKRPSTRHLDS